MRRERRRLNYKRTIGKKSRKSRAFSPVLFVLSHNRLNLLSFTRDEYFKICLLMIICFSYFSLTASFLPQCNNPRFAYDRLIYA